MNRKLLLSILLFSSLSLYGQTNKVLLKSGEIDLINELQEINKSGLTYCFLVFEV